MLVDFPIAVVGLLYECFVFQKKKENRCTYINETRERERDKRDIEINSKSEEENSSKLAVHMRKCDE